MRQFRKALILLCIPCLAQTAPRVPDEVRCKSGYINPIPKPPDFTSAMLWGIAIADIRIPGYGHGHVEIAAPNSSAASTAKTLSSTTTTPPSAEATAFSPPLVRHRAHDPLPLAYSKDRKAVILRVGENPDRVWHFWSASPRAALPPGHLLQGCTVTAVSKISAAPCCKWAWITGATPPSATAPAATTTKPAPAIGISRRKTGRRQYLLMLSTTNRVGRTLPSASLRAGFVRRL